MYIKTHLRSSRGCCCCRSDNCFESYTERELLQKTAHFKEFGDSSEIVSVVTWNIDCARLNKVCKIVVFFCWLDYTITSEEILKSTLKQICSLNTRLKRTQYTIVA